MRVPSALLLSGLMLSPTTVWAASPLSRFFGPAPRKVPDHTRKAREPQPTAQSAQAQKQTQKVQQFQSAQSALARDQKLLQQRLAQAQKMRQMGLQRNDFKLLKQAEQIERSAFAQYQIRVQQLERLGNRLQTLKGKKKATNSSRPAASIPKSRVRATGRRQKGR